MKKTILKVATICLMGTSLFASTAPEAKSTTTSPSEILKQSLGFIAKLDKYKFTAVSKNSLLDSHRTLRDQYTNEYKVLVDRPYKAKIEVEGTTKYREYYFNTGRYTLYNEEQIKYWGDITTPQNLNDALDFMTSKYGVRPPVAILIDANMIQKIHPKSITYFGTQTKNGTLCHSLAFKTKDKKRTIYVWIAAHGNPLVMAYSIVRKSDVNEYKIDIDVKWDLSPWISDSDFIFTKRNGNKKIPIQIRKSRQF